MKHTLLFVSALALFIPVAFAAKDTPQSGNILSPKGLWLTENERSVISVEDCEVDLCGYVHWIIEGGMQYDTENPNDRKRGEPMCGLPIMWGMEQNKNDPKEWDDGYIYKADDGDTYNARLEMLDKNTMKVRGYMGISLLGKSQTWTRVTKDNYPECTLPGPVENKPEKE